MSTDEIEAREWKSLLKEITLTQKKTNNLIRIVRDEQIDKTQALEENTTMIERIVDLITDNSEFNKKLKRIVDHKEKEFSK